MKLSDLIYWNKKGFSKMIVMIVLLAGSSLMHAQQQRVHLTGSQLTLKDAFKQIEHQTKLFVDYNIRDVNDSKVLKHIPQAEKVKEVMEQLLRDTDCAITFKNGHIIITKQAIVPDKTKLITGTITDAKGIPVIGANVIQKGTTHGVITDIDGNFTLGVPENAIVQVSYIGYNTTEIATAGKNTLNIHLDENALALDEVVVVGYGTQKKINLTGAVGVATSKDLQGKATINALEALQGVIPNFNINYANGEPGKEPTINVRGYASIKDGGPLIVIDGVNSDSYMLSRMNSEDIESISVLKDAASAAIYGARAAFGVVLVTTKSGNRNVEKVSVNFTSNLIRSTPTKRPKMTNAYVHASTVNEALRRRGEPTRFKEEDVEKMRL